MKVAVIGGGAAGFFAAISAKSHHGTASVTILEKSNKLLSKVKISGGGRCNVTNGTSSPKDFLNSYPRGRKMMKKLFQQLDNHQVMKWFESRGVNLKVENDGRVFPKSDNSQSIINCLKAEAAQLDIEIRIKENIVKIIPHEDHFILHTLKGSKENYDKVIIASGGSPKRARLSWLEEMGHELVTPVPSLFTFNMPKQPITSLMGVVAPNALVKIQGMKLQSHGPLLITHWGMSGPAILKLSAFAARALYDKQYQFKITVNWVNLKEEEIKESLRSITNKIDKKQLKSFKPFDLPERLWLYLFHKNEISPTKRWNELGKKGINKLTASLSNDEYSVNGKTTFKEEFVTAGGISLSSINTNTMESNAHKGLYFAGEVLDVDGITGGFNFQAAWSTGYVAGQLKG